MNWWKIRRVQASIVEGLGYVVTISLIIMFRLPFWQIGTGGDLGGCLADMLVRLRAIC